MAIKIGDTMPPGVFKVVTSDGSRTMSTEEMFSGKKVVLFSVPGAFTPTCSTQHLPGYIQKAGELKAKGIHDIFCMAVNDLFVMDAWGEHSSVGNKVILLADGNGDYTKSLGLEVDMSRYRMGIRGQRFALVVDDGIVSQLHVEEAGELKVSTAEHILENL